MNTNTFGWLKKKKMQPFLASELISYTNKNSSNAPALLQLILQKVSLFQLCGDVCEGGKEMGTLSSDTTKIYPRLVWNLTAVTAQSEVMWAQSFPQFVLAEPLSGECSPPKYSFPLPSLWFPLSFTGYKTWALHPQLSSQRCKPSAPSPKVIMQSPRGENWCNTFPQHLKTHNRPLLAMDITSTEYTRAEM